MRTIQHEVLQSLSGLFAGRPAVAHKANKSAATLATCGAFTLRAGHAITLRSPAKAVLRIVQGGAWVTLPSQPGDHFLRVGDTLQVHAGDTLVMEAWRVPAGHALCFDWGTSYGARHHRQAALADLRAALLMCSGR